MFYKIKTKEILVNYRKENNMSENEKINPIDAMVIVAKAWSEYKKDETKKAEMDRIAAEYNEEHGRKAAPKQKDNASDKNELKKEEPKEKELKKEEPSAGNITDQNFLEAGHSHGINTVGQSLKNANKQLRSDPPIPKVNVGPWNGSTVDPDTNRKCFEIEA
jgi:hypothetical protein